MHATHYAQTSVDDGRRQTHETQRSRRTRLSGDALAQFGATAIGAQALPRRDAGIQAGARLAPCLDSVWTRRLERGGLKQLQDAATRGGWDAAARTTGAWAWVEREGASEWRRTSPATLLLGDHDSAWPRGLSREPVSRCAPSLCRKR